MPIIFHRELPPAVIRPESNQYVTRPTVLADVDQPFLDDAGQFPAHTL